jgi:DNA polymerase-3 subunit alpha
VEARAVTRSAIECLIKAGAMDTLGNGSRSRLLAGVERAIALGQQQQKMRRSGQFSLFGDVDDGGILTFDLPDVPEHPRDEQLAWEKDLLGIYLSRHPLTHLEPLLKSRVTTLIPFLNEEWAGQQITLGGRVVTARKIITKKGTTMVIAFFEDLQGSMEVTVFPRVYEETAALWREEAKLFISGKIEMRDEEVKLIVEHAEEIIESEAETEPHAIHHLQIRLRRNGHVAKDIILAQDVMRTIQRFPGPDTFELLIPLNTEKQSPGQNGRYAVFVPTDHHVNYCPELHLALEQLLGTNTVSITRAQPPASLTGAAMAVAE